MIQRLRDRSFNRRRLLLFPLDLYAAGVIGYLLLRLLGAHSYIWPIEIISAYLHLLLLPAIPLLVLTILIRNWRTAALLSIAAAAFVWLFGGLFLPKPRSPHSAFEFTVLSYNTANGHAPWRHLSRVIRASGADVVALQETIESEVPLYRSDLADLYPHQVFHGSGLAGLGLLSRYPIRHEELIYLASSRPYLVADLEIGEHTLTVIDAHPLVIMGPGAARAEGRFDYPMMAELAADRGDTILAGDLNLTDQNAGYAALMKRGLIDAHREAGLGLGLTFPRRLGSRWTYPGIRIDFILTTPDLQPLEAWVGEDGGSDHLPVLARIVWKDGG